MTYSGEIGKKTKVRGGDCWRSATTTKPRRGKSEQRVRGAAKTTRCFSKERDEGFVCLGGRCAFLAAASLCASLSFKVFSLCLIPSLFYLITAMCPFFPRSLCSQSPRMSLLECGFAFMLHMNMNKIILLLFETWFQCNGRDFSVWKLDSLLRFLEVPWLGFNACLTRSNSE